MENIP